MTARERLLQYSIIKRKIREQEAINEDRFRNDREKIMKLKESLILPAVALDGMPHAPQASKDRIGDVLAEIDEIVRKAHERVRQELSMRDGAMELMLCITQEILKVENATERMILIFRYIREYPWSEIADKVSAYQNWGYSKEYIRNRLHNKALEDFADANGYQKG